jgi:hypothetical protein
MSNPEIVNLEIDIFEFAGRGEEIPHARSYRVRIDHHEVKVDTASPTGKELMSKVHKRPCAFELIAEYVHRENEVVEPDEKVDLRKHGLRGFITAQKEIVTILGSRAHTRSDLASIRIGSGWRSEAVLRYLWTAQTVPVPCYS